MKTAVLVSGVVLLGLLGAAGGYEVGRLTQPDDLTRSADAGFTPSEQETPLPRKTPVPSDLAAFTADGLRYRNQKFSVGQGDRPKVEVSLDVPRGWNLTRSPDTPGEVKFLDALRERAIRVESGFAPERTTSESRAKLVGELEASQPYENALTIEESSDSVVTGEDGEPRAVSTLIYTYIPRKTVRYVIVRWVATGDDDRATVEMSITGLPQDADGLRAVTERATTSVTVKD